MPSQRALHHLAGVRRDDRHVARDGEVEAEVDLLVDLLALVDVGAVIGERRFDLRVAELHERSVPQYRRRRLLREAPRSRRRFFAAARR